MCEWRVILSGSLNTILDYNATTPETYEFFKIVQNKLHYAVSGHTASEIIFNHAKGRGINVINNEKHRKIAFVTDFDGTITNDDFFQYVGDAFFDDSALAPWRLYLKGKLSHFEALRQMYGSLRVCEKELIDLLKKVAVDEWVIPTFELLRDAQIPIYIASAGCDYYINLLVGGEIEKYGVNLVTNSSRYSQAEGLLMERPSKDNRFYDENVGISKKKIVEYLHQNDRRVIYAGDGPPDIDPARIADIVFAKKILLKKCIEEGIKTLKFSDYKDIYNFFEGELKK